MSERTEDIIEKEISLAKKAVYCEDCKFMKIDDGYYYCRKHPIPDKAFVLRGKSLEMCKHINEKGRCSDFEKKDYTAYCVAIVCAVALSFYIYLATHVPK